MQRYFDGASTAAPAPASRTEPGSTLTDTIDLFLAQGVVPDLLPADLGTDDQNELDADGYPSVDPMGDIRSDPMELRERLLVSSAGDRFVEAYSKTQLDDMGNPPVPPASPAPSAPPAPPTE